MSPEAPPATGHGVSIHSPPQPVVIDLTIDPPPAAATTSHTAGRLPLPSSIGRWKVRWPYASVIVILHLAVLLAALPYFFTWTGLITCIIGVYLIGMLGINVGYHRLLTHRSFTCPKWVEHTLALLGICGLQEAPGRWVAIHRRHHQHSDTQPDPHSPMVAFLWGHVGWLIIENPDTGFYLYQRYAGDLFRQPFYMRLERRLCWLWLYWIHAALFGLIGLGIGLLIAKDLPGAIRFAASLVLWGVIVRTVLVWHFTWSVNSLSHLFGYRSHNTGENSRNNWFVALIANGEGWHNNHHADQVSAAHGHRWWELDLTYLSILALEAVGLASNVKRPDRHEH